MNEVYEERTIVDEVGEEKTFSSEFEEVEYYEKLKDKKYRRVQDFAKADYVAVEEFSKWMKNVYNSRRLKRLRRKINKQHG